MISTRDKKELKNNSANQKTHDITQINNLGCSFPLKNLKNSLQKSKTLPYLRNYKFLR